MARKTSKRKTSKSIKLRKRFSHYSNIKKALVFAILFAIIGVIGLIAASAYMSPYDNFRQASLKADPKSGLVYNGLKAIKKDADHPCKGIFEVENSVTNGRPACSHGPDAAPAGVDIRKVSVEDKIKELEKLPHTKITEEQLKSGVDTRITANYIINYTNSMPFKESAIKCTSGGHRIQLVILTHVSDPATLAKLKYLYQHTAYRLETLLQYSSLHSGTGSTIKHFRFVTNSNCEPTVSIHVAGDDFQGYDDISKIRTYLSHRGYNDDTKKYIVWDYANGTGICGVAEGYRDSTPNALTNDNNQFYSFAVIAHGCWGNVEMHEIMHTLGAVQLDAPRTSGGFHCLDNWDIMCGPEKYCKRADGSTFGCGLNDKPVYVDAKCSDPFFDWQLDCNKNDYFNSGYVSPNHYLYNHWNTAKSPFFQ